MNGRGHWMTWLPTIAAVVLALTSWGTALAQEDDDQAGGDTSTMYLDVGNPSSGDSLHVGAYTMEGIAFDSAADPAPGIDHIDIFLDDRNTGGTLIGHGQMYAASPEPDDPGLQGSGWTAQVVIPKKRMGSHVLFVYALSGATGEEMVVGVPVQVVP
jgi:hypothetical protein